MELFPKSDVRALKGWLPDDEGNRSRSGEAESFLAGVCSERGRGGLRNPDSDPNVYPPSRLPAA